MPYQEGQVLTHSDGRQVTLRNNEWVPVQAAGQAEDVDFSLGEMISNIPSSALEFGRNIIQPIISPIETAKSVGGLMRGAVEKGAHELAKALPDEFLLQFAEGDPSGVYRRPEWGGEKKAEAVGEFFKERYGSIPALKQTLMTDPVGSLADVATIATGGGAAMARMPSLMGKAGGIIQKTGMALEPLSLAKGITKTGVGMMTPKTLPIGLYKSAAKFPTTLDIKHGLGTRTRLAETALKHGIMPTEKGVLKLAQYEKELGLRIGSLIDDVAESGKSIPKSKVFKHLKEARQSVGGARVGAQRHTQQINKVAKELNEQMRKIKGDSLTPRQLQDLKISAQKAAKYDPGTVRETGTELGSKAIAKAAKEQIEELIPDIRDINKELGTLKELKDPLTRAAARIEQKDIISLGAPVKVMTGQAVGGPAGAVGGFLAGMVESKKAQLALKLRRIQDAGLGNLIDQSLVPTLIKEGLWQAGRLEPENEGIR